MAVEVSFEGAAFKDVDDAVVLFLTFVTKSWESARQLFHRRPGQIRQSDASAIQTIEDTYLYTNSDVTPNLECSRVKDGSYEICQARVSANT